MDVSIGKVLYLVSLFENCINVSLEFEADVRINELLASA